MTHDTELEKATRQALEALESDWDGCVNSQKGEAIFALRQALAEKSSGTEQSAQKRPQNCGTGYCSCIECVMEPEQPAQDAPVTDNTYGYAKSLAEAIFKQHFASDEHYASGRIVWGVNDTVIGILTQIDNMVADMVRRSEQPAQQEPARERVGLTDKELDDLWVLHHDHCGQPKTSAQNGWAYERAIEAKLREKNA